MKETKELIALVLSLILLFITALNDQTLVFTSLAASLVIALVFSLIVSLFKPSQS